MSRDAAPARAIRGETRPGPRAAIALGLLFALVGAGCRSAGPPRGSVDPRERPGVAVGPDPTRRASHAGRPAPDPGIVRAAQAPADDDDDDDDDDEAMAAPAAAAAAATAPGAGRGGSSLSPIRNREGPFDADDRPTRGDEGGEADEGPQEGASGFVQPDLLQRLLRGHDSRHRLYGWVEGAFLGNPLAPRDHRNLPNTTSDLANRFQVPQAYLVAERTMEAEGEWDWGYRFDSLFGTDWELFHADGLFEGAFRPQGYGYEPTQLFGEVHLPVLTEGGLDVRAGRFLSLAGYESAFAPGRPLRSTSYLFNYSHPFTHLGVLTTLNVSDRLQVFNAAVNGWDRWFNQHNSWGYVGGIDWTSRDEETNLAFSGYAGPNQISRRLPKELATGPDLPPGPRRRVRGSGSQTMLLSGVLTRKWNERWTAVSEVDFGAETRIPLFANDPGGEARNSAWYGGSIWLLRTLGERWTGVVRAEAFRDVGGVRTGFDDLYSEATLGLIYKPKPWFWVRPEVRYDGCAGAPAFDAGHARNQVTLGFDVLLLF